MLHRNIKALLMIKDMMEFHQRIYLEIATRKTYFFYEIYLYPYFERLLHLKSLLKRMKNCVHAL